MTDLESGEYENRARALSGDDLIISKDMIREEISKAEKELQQAKKRLDRLLRK